MFKFQNLSEIPTDGVVFDGLCPLDEALHAAAEIVLRWRSGEPEVLGYAVLEHCIVVRYSAVSATGYRAPFEEYATRYDIRQELGRQDAEAQADLDAAVDAGFDLADDDSEN